MNESIQQAHAAAWKETELFFGKNSEKGWFCPTRMIWGAGVAGPWLTRMIEAIDGRALVVVDSALEAKEIVVNLRRLLGDRGVWITAQPLPEAHELQALSQTLPWKDITCVIAIGGGSAIDTAKAVMAQWLFEGGYDGIGMANRRGEPVAAGKVKPLFIAVPSTAGSGAETSRYLVTYAKHATRWGKIHGKSWVLVADIALLDGDLLLGAPIRVLVEPAFDAFVHCAESYLSEGESNVTTRMVCLQSIGEIMQVMGILDRGTTPDTTQLTTLLHAASMAGVAISNARTGHIHEAGGASLEWGAARSHAQTLWIFAREGFRQTARSANGARKQAELAAAAGLPDMAAVLDFWQNLLRRAGTTDEIARSLAQLSASGNMHKAMQTVEQRISDDLVWCTKESPAYLDKHDAAAMAAMMESFNP